MLKLKYNISFLEARAYWSHNFAEEMDAGFRLSLDLGSLHCGGTMIWENFEHKNEKYHYELDAQYDLMKLFQFSVQTSSVNDKIDQTDDLKIFGKISFKKGFELPVAGKIKPYAGFDSFQNNKDRISLAGLNFEPIPNAFIKAEYRTNTENDLNDVLEFQVGYVF
ncbi:MAG: hypothetical protein K9N09_11660 [Candidatus Cloacimonetes bacterium]|nr:hypothetical protein [Candidatus Cloacimonadota bacterium]MCF7814661.1 hypothetical protein [Candidatus Cloacimonadota bacterium]MCF7869340.1 hypothetical protein [Candidatus Cloacimonadota bacterium]MCF7884553.1 hypothetical protein [Candidatus Cloacimonadota bacterium]